MPRRTRIAWILAAAVLSAGAPASWCFAEDPAMLQRILTYKPTQPQVDYEIPTAEETGKCKLEIERTDKGSGFLLHGPQGQLLRRFLDTNGDGKVDEFRYFKHGLEVYRDIDSNANNEVDQCRWMNMGGTRWGLDPNEDRKIDSWKLISAEEATREAILAMVNRDEKRLMAVMLTPQDIKSLGLTGDTAKRLTTNINEAGNKLRTTLASTKLINPKTEWLRFDCSMLMPNLIPADPAKAKNDLLVYENVMAHVQNGDQPGYVQIGEMVRVGDSWKLTQVPQPLEGERLAITDGGIIFQPTPFGGMPTAEGLSPRMKELLDQLRELDEQAPQTNPKPEDLAKYNIARAKMLAAIAEEAPTDDEKLMWRKQRLEGIAAATQMGSYPSGIDELKKAEQELRRSGEDQNLLAFAIFQRLLAEYNLSLASATTADRAKIQENWLKSLEDYVKEFPTAPDSADAVLQLAITHEYNGDLEKARAWYQKAVDGYGQSTSAARARGAMRRLESQGKPLKIVGKSLDGQTIDTTAYRGKVLAVIYWATWCQPCTEELPQIKDLYRQHQKAGFEIVGVNLDAGGAPIQQYIQNFAIPWPHIHEEGALESRPAVDYGVISLPTMFLVDRNGLVVTPSATLDDLKKQVPELLKK